MKRHLLAAALGVAMASALALAQQATEVTVEAAREAPLPKQTYGGIRVEEVTLKRRVSYSDLDLTTQAGTAALEKRVQETARAACKELDRLYPLTAPGGDSCYKKALDDAMAQVHAAVAAVEKKVKQ